MKYEFESDELSKYERNLLRKLVKCRYVEFKARSFKKLGDPPKHPYKIFLGLSCNPADKERVKLLDDFLKSNFPIIEGCLPNPDDALPEYTAPVVIDSSSDGWWLNAKEPKCLYKVIDFLQQHNFQAVNRSVQTARNQDEMGQQMMKVKLEEALREFEALNKPKTKLSKHQRGYG